MSTELTSELKDTILDTLLEYNKLLCGQYYHCNDQEERAVILNYLHELNVVYMDFYLLEPK